MSGYGLRLTTINSVVSALALGFCTVASADSNDKADAPVEGPVFVPPEIGAPADRLGAGTRDIDIAT